MRVATRTKVHRQGTLSQSWTLTDVKFSFSSAEMIGNSTVGIDQSLRIKSQVILSTDEINY